MFTGLRISLMRCKSESDYYFTNENTELLIIKITGATIFPLCHPDASCDAKARC